MMLKDLSGKKEFYLPKVNRYGEVFLDALIKERLDARFTFQAFRYTFLNGKFELTLQLDHPVEQPEKLKKSDKVILIQNALTERPEAQNLKLKIWHPKVKLKEMDTLTQSRRKELQDTGEPFFIKENWRKHDEYNRGEFYHPFTEGEPLLNKLIENRGQLEELGATFSRSFKVYPKPPYPKNKVIYTSYDFGGEHKAEAKLFGGKTETTLFGYLEITKMVEPLNIYGNEIQIKLPTHRPGEIKPISKQADHRYPRIEIHFPLLNLPGLIQILEAAVLPNQRLSQF